jgi:hypothetical protein
VESGLARDELQQATLEKSFEIGMNVAFLHYYLLTPKAMFRIRDAISKIPKCQASQISAWKLKLL